MDKKNVFARNKHLQPVIENFSPEPSKPYQVQQSQTKHKSNHRNCINNNYVMEVKVNIKLTQKGSKSHDISFSTNHETKIVEMWIKTRDWDLDDSEGSWVIENVSFTDGGKAENCVWDGIINKWMLEQNT